MNLLMFSGDETIALGQQGPFFYTLQIFAQYWERIDVLLPRPARPPCLTKIHQHVYLHTAAVPRYWQSWFLWQRTRTLLRQRPYQLLLSHDFGFLYNGWAALSLSALTGLPYISEIHHIAGYPRAANYQEIVQQGVLAAYLCLAARQALAFRVVNQQQAPRFLARCHVPATKIKVIPSFYIDLKVFAPQDIGKDYDVVWCGRLVPNKGLDLLLETLCLVQKQWRPLRVALVGQGPLEETVAQQAARAGLSLDMLGWLPAVEDLARLYNRARVLMVTSYNEGGPRVALEAMACQVPVLSTPVGIMPELLADRRAGRLAPWQPAALAQTLIEMLQNEDLARMGVQARERMQPFERRQALAYYAHTCQQLVATRPRYRANVGARAAATVCAANSPVNRGLRILFITQDLGDDHDILGITPVWLRALAAQVAHVHVLALSVGQVTLPDNVSLYSMGKIYGDRRRTTWLGKLHLLVNYVRIVERLLAQGALDVILAHMIPHYASLAVPLAWPRKVPVWLWYAHKSVDFPLKVAHALVNGVLTPSAESFRCPSHKLRITGHGIDAQSFHVDWQEHAKSLTRPLILAVGRLAPIKHYETIIKAVQILHSQFQEQVALCIVGGAVLAEQSGYAHALKLQIKQAQLDDWVSITGCIPYSQVPAYYRRATLFASDSDTGSIDKTILEAIAAGLPPLVSNEAYRPILGALAPQFMFTKRNALELAQRIRQVLQAYRQAPATLQAQMQQLQTRVYQQHDVHAQMARIIAILQNSLATGR